MGAKKGKKNKPLASVPMIAPDPAPVLRGSRYPNDGVLVVHSDETTVVEMTIMGVTERHMHPRGEMKGETRVSSLPRLYVGTNVPIPQFETEAVGTEFDRIAEPVLTSSDPKFHAWRRVTWRVVPHLHYGRRTTAFRVVNEVPLTEEEVCYWKGQVLA